MKRSMPVAVAAAATALCLVAPASAAPATVGIGEFFYEAKRVQINPGEAVTWTNKGDIEHTVTSRPGSPQRFDSDQLGAGQVFTRTFAKPGRYAYLCTIHPDQMSGVVQVGPDTTPARLTKVRSKRGAASVRITFRLSEDAKVRITITRRGKRIKAFGTKTLGQGSAAVVYRKALTAGRYKVKLVATDVAGNRSKAASTSVSVPR